MSDIALVKKLILGLNEDQGVYSFRTSAVIAAGVNVTSKHAGKTESLLPQNHISKQGMYPIIKEL